MQALVVKHKAAVRLEEQARACEYDALFAFDSLRPQLLEHMPVLDESRYARNIAPAAEVDMSAEPAAAQVRWLHRSGWFSPAGSCLDFWVGLIDTLPLKPILSFSSHAVNAGKISQQLPLGVPAGPADKMDMSAEPAAAQVSCCLCPMDSKP